MVSIKGNVVDIVARSVFYAEVVIDNGFVLSINPLDGVGDTYLCPGFVDSHVHIESSMLTPFRFSEVAVSHGTVAIVTDPHELSNVLGKDGFMFMYNDALNALCKIYFGVPSCVPATSFETSGSVLSVPEIDDLLQLEKVVCLSEMMNYPGVIYNDLDVLSKLETARKHKKPIDGHAPGLVGLDLSAYASAGITTDHECTTLNEAINKINVGIKVLIREGSAAKNLEALHSLINTHIDHVMLCSDDKHPDDLTSGHINEAVKTLIAYGYNLFDVLQAACLNAIKHYNLNVGYLQVGHPADFIVVDNLTNFKILTTYVSGKPVYSGSFLPAAYRVNAINNFNCNLINTDLIKVSANGTYINVIEALDKDLYTKKLVFTPCIDNGYIVSDTTRDILKIVVLNRYNPNVLPVVGFIKNFGLKHGALASCIAHDSHNIICVGVSDVDIVSAINTIVKNKGGICVVSEFKTIALPLEIGGILSSDTAENVGNLYADCDKMAKTLGCELTAPFMTLSFMALLVIPEFKIGDKFLFNGIEFEPEVLQF